MTQPEQAIDIAAVDMPAHAPSKPAGATFVAALTIVLSIFNVLTEGVYDVLEFADVVPYRGLGWTIFGGFLFIVSSFTAMTRGRVALIVSVAISIYYITTIILPALR